MNFLVKMGGNVYEIYIPDFSHMGFYYFSDHKFPNDLVALV